MKLIGLLVITLILGISALYIWLDWAIGSFMGVMFWLTMTVIYGGGWIALIGLIIDDSPSP